MQRGPESDLQELRCHEGMFRIGLPAVYAYMGRVVIVVPGLDAQYAAHRAACVLEILHFELQKTPTSPEGKVSAQRLSYLIDPTGQHHVWEVLKPVGREIALVVTELEGHKSRAPTIVQGAWTTVADHVMVATKFGSRHFRRLEASHLARLSVLGLYREPATCRASSPPAPG